MEVVEIATPAPGPKQALVRIAASGVNFIDVYFRTGLYKADLPMTLGSEAAGIVEAVGPGRYRGRAGRPRRVRDGARLLRRVCRSCPRRSSSSIPDSLDFQTAAAAMLQGMTAHYLTHSTYPLKSGDTCLVHAAAGGAGGLIVQMAKMLGRACFRDGFD